MQETLLSEYLSPQPQAKVLVLFGGSPVQRDRVIRQLSSIPALTIWGTLSEAEGLQKVQELDRVDMVLIGGRYTQEQRIRIRKLLSEQAPGLRISEPGIDYPYSTDEIIEQIKTLF